MGRRRKELKHYPKVFFDIVIAFSKGEKGWQLRAKDSGSAQAIMHDFNRFKQSMINEEHPLAELALDIQVRKAYLGAPGANKEDSNYVGFALDFTTKGLYNLANELKGLPTLAPTDKEGLPEFNPKPVPMTRDAEELIEKIYGKVKTNEQRRSQEGLSVTGEEVPACPPHEYDELTDGCIKCKLPKEKW